MTDTSLTQSAYTEIKRMLVRLELAPGSLISEDDLQKRLGIGRTPIHQAIQRLAREQLVTVLPRRGVYVSTIDIMDLPMLYESRATLEPYLVRLAAIRATPRHLDEMRSILDAAATSNVGVEHLVEVDRRCHEIIWDAAGNRFLVDTLDMLYTLSDRLWHLHLYNVTDMRDALAEHATILEALTARQPEVAANLMLEHLRTFEGQIQAVITHGLRSPLAQAAARDS